jgi:alpha-amylase/alpha-mannosidase (GH57 family)
MGQQPLNVMILWHMHQPYYKDVTSNEYLMPWVRLHATKDYLDMPLLASEYPNLRVTFNMVPSLLEQIEEYGRGEAEDRFLRLARKRAEELDDEERLQLVQTFFGAQPERMIKPHVRYRQLYERRGWTRDMNELRRAAQSFSPGDLRDLQAWFYLTWIDPYLRQRDPRLQELVKKERMFSEQEKLDVLEIGRVLTAQVVPTMKKLWDEGRIEISTTPYFHPILPLLLDTDIARRARPRVALPSRRFQHPEDARLQIKLGLDYCERLFGRRPRGMWPSEGSVCPELIPMFQAEGVQWIATDEDILACSLGDERFWRDKDGQVNNMDALYRPYEALHAADGAEARVAIFFRDRVLSDLIGFKYLNWNPQDAAADLIRRLEEIQFLQREATEPQTVSIILDGENCWEHYEQDGLPFLRTLYQGLNDHRLLRTVTPSQAIEEQKPTRTVRKLHSGSWINHDFAIWIGHAEDNAAWNLLAQAREDVGARLAPPKGLLEGTSDEVNTWKSILIAEGSDWNWWYGEDHTSGIDDQFDELYRRHLRNAYAGLGIEPPARLQIPISAGGDTGLQTQPVALIRPHLDGRETNYYEWFSAGHYDPRRGGDSMHQADQDYVVQGLRFGFDLEKFYLRVDLAEDWRPGRVKEQADLVFYFFTRRNYMILCPLGAKGGGKDATAPLCRVFAEQAQGGWEAAGELESIRIDTIVEAAFAFERFEIAEREMLRFQVAVEVDGEQLERCPSRTPLATQVPSGDFEEEMWIV